METQQSAMKAADRAIEQAGLAYEFNPGSYTFWAYTECLRVRDALDGPWWIEEFLDY